MRKYIGQWSIVTAFLFGVALLGIPLFFGDKATHPSDGLTVLFMSALTLGVHWLGQRAIQKGGEESVAYLMAAFGIQMLGSAVYAAIGLLQTFPGDTRFALAFLVVFTIYLLFEIRALLAILRPQNRG